MFLELFITKLRQNEIVRRAFHTFWQAFIATFLAGMFDVLSAFQHNFSAGKSASLALVIAALASGLSALRTAYKLSNQ